MKIAIGIYLTGMLVFWFHGKPTPEWNVFYYSLEKLFSAAGFGFLAYYAPDKTVRRFAVYACAICLFMFMYFIYCMVFGHDATMAAAAFLMYSFFIVIFIK